MTIERRTRRRNAHAVTLHLSPLLYEWVTWASGYVGESVDAFIRSGVFSQLVRTANQAREHGHPYPDGLAMPDADDSDSESDNDSPAIG